jgi:hypothetical protein
MSDDHTAIIPAEAVEIVENHQPEVLHPLVQSMQARGDLTPENIERMMDLQERHEARIAKHEFDAARARLLNDLPPVISKNRRVAFGNTRYSYADLPQVIRSVMPALRAHGFSVSWRNESDSRTEAVTCILSHCGGHEIENTRKAVVEPKKGQSAVQSSQSTVTYLERHTLLSILGVVTDDMPDADEPQKPAPTTVNTRRNANVCTRLRKEHGIDASEAVEFIGKPVAEWTAADIDRIPGWLEERGGS